MRTSGAWPFFTPAPHNEAILAGADLVRVDLRLVDFAQADLRRADLSGAIVRAVNLVGAVYDGTTIWPHGFRLGLSVMKKLVVALDTEAPKSTLSAIGRASFGKDHLLQQKTELKEGRSIACRDRYWKNSARSSRLNVRKSLPRWRG